MRPTRCYGRAATARRRPHSPGLRGTPPNARPSRRHGWGRRWRSTRWGMPVVRSRFCGWPLRLLFTVPLRRRARSTSSACASTMGAPSPRRRPCSGPMPSSAAASRWRRRSCRSTPARLPATATCSAPRRSGSRCSRRRDWGSNCGCRSCGSARAWLAWPATWTRAAAGWANWRRSRTTPRCVTSWRRWASCSATWTSSRRSCGPSSREPLDRGGAAIRPGPARCGLRGRPR